MKEKRTGPLTGVMVIELAHIMAGPACGMLLADLGADVIKVEKLPGGDSSRDMVPPSIQGESAAFMMLNRNKRGIALDLKREGGKEVLRTMLRKADVLIENYRTGTMDKLGFGYETLHAFNPGLIYCAISGFGRSGPFASLPGFDLIAQGYSGLMSITGEGPDRPPVKVGVPITDITAGMLAALGIVSAYVERQRSGIGQLVETSLFEAGIAQTFWQSAITLATGTSPEPMGSAHPLSAPYQAFVTADGWINIGASSEASWRRLPPVLGMSELLRDPRFRTNADRMEHRTELTEILAVALAGKTTKGWLALLESAGVPAGPVLDIAAMLEHPQTLAREMVKEVDHAKLGKVKSLGCPIKFSESPTAVPSAAPILGQDTTHVLAEFGYSESAITELHEMGAVFCA